MSMQTKVHIFREDHKNMTKPPNLDFIKLGCPGQGPASGSPRRGPRPFGDRAGRGQYFRPSGCIGAGPRSLLKRQGRSVLAMSRPRPSFTCIKFIFTRIQHLLMSYIWYEIHSEVASIYNSPIFYCELDFPSPLVALPGKGCKQCTVAVTSEDRRNLRWTVNSACCTCPA